MARRTPARDVAGMSTEQAWARVVAREVPAPQDEDGWAAYDAVGEAEDLVDPVADVDDRYPVGPEPANQREQPVDHR